MSYQSFKLGLYQKGDSSGIEIPYIAGVTKYEGVPAKMRIMVCDRLEGKVLASGKSKDDGTFKRYLPDDYVADKQCFVVTFDDTGVYNAQISDLINAVT